MSGDPLLATLGESILELRRLHRELDKAIRDAHGWFDLDLDLDLGHDFHEVETLSENDRVRYTLSLAVRKEVLKRLPAENHRRAGVEGEVSDMPAPANRKRGIKSAITDNDGELF